jgi:beta-galactosidase
MCSEFWSGWFDKWGARHETRPADDMVAGIDEMLGKGISFSLYMTHGGTSFGHWAGANSPGFAPDVTSYDYDAPINEYGLATEKYTLLRNVLQKYTDKKLPAVPALPAPQISVPQFELTEYAPLTAGIARTERSRDVRTMEQMDMGFGSMVYETTLPAIDRASVLTLNDAHDFAQVYIDGEYIGKIDRVKNEKSLLIPAVKDGATLTITLEAMGRINFGRAIKDFKGITQSATLRTESASGHELTYDLKQWTIGLIPDAYEDAVKALQGEASSEVAALHTKAGYYRGYFTLKKTGDTFLNTSAFGKGQVYVNGHALGRYWKIGPQQTLYLPGCWLKKGRNEVIVLDVVGPEAAPTLFAQNHPELDELHLEKSNKHNDPGQRPDLNSATPAAVGQFAPGNGWQTVKLDAAAKGRYLAIECRSAHQGEAVAIAELYEQDAQGQRLSREPWSARYADSENDLGNHTLDKVFDLQESTYWQTERGATLPHLLVIDLGSEQEISAIEYLPRAEQGAPGSVKDFAVYIY